MTCSLRGILAGAVFSFLFLSMALGADEPVSVTILHTNDVHSHFKSDRSPLRLGGLARLKTVIDSVRAEVPNALLVDGGDWSEGQIYYVEGTGAESLRLMDELGYDVAVVGNHDWLNGPSHLLGAIAAANPKMALVGANFDPSQWNRAEEFKSRILPFVIREVAGARIAFIGMANYDPLYAGYLKPVLTQDPTPLAAQLSTHLKDKVGVDAVVVISHNGIDANRTLLEAAPEVDLVIGAHDHQLLRNEIRVPRPGYADGWIVEAGMWGRYLGRVDMQITPRGAGRRAGVSLVSYRLKQVDRRFPEDPGILARVAQVEAKIAATMGNVFEDGIARSQVDLYRGGTLETPIGAFATDAYRLATGADIAIDHNNFVSGELHEGRLNSADFFNANPTIYNPDTGKSWTIQTWSMNGYTLSALLKLMYLWRRTMDSGGMSFSGLEMVLDTLEQKDTLVPSDLFRGFMGFQSGVVRALTVGGREVSSAGTYKIAASPGIVEALKQINAKYWNLVPIDNLVDTGIEQWRAMVDHARVLNPIRASDVDFGSRIRTLQSDLGIVYEDFHWTYLGPATTPGYVRAKVSVTVRNFGATPSFAGSRVGLWLNTNGSDESVERQWIPFGGDPKSLPSLEPGQRSSEFVWDELDIPVDAAGLCSINASVQYPKGTETHVENDSMTRIFFIP